MVRCCSLLLAAALLLVGCGSSEEPAPPQPGAFDTFDETVDAFLQAEGLAGATAVVVHRDDGVLHLRGYGSFDPDRIMLIASSSKIISVGVLMQLADDGLLDLDAPISDYLGAWGQHKTNISVAQLLSNSSGMVGLLQDATYPPYICQFVPTGTLTECGEAIYTADDGADLIPPDSEFRYGGGQWQLAGAVAEVVSGKSWAQLVDEIYLQPCGLTATGYGNHFLKAAMEGQGGMALEASYPLFFQGDPANLDPTDNPSIEGGAYSNASDYAELLLMHLRGGSCGETRVLSEAAVARMQQDRIQAYGGVTIDPTLPGYGMGWWIDRENPVVADAGAYGAMPWLDLGRGYGVMILLEGGATQGAFLRFQAKPVLDEIFDARAQ